MPANNNILFDLYFNLTNKSNLIDRLKYDFFDHLVLTFWATLYIVDNSASSIRWVIFHKVLRRHYSGEI